MDYQARHYFLPESGKRFLVIFLEKVLFYKIPRIVVLSPTMDFYCEEFSFGKLFIIVGCLLWRIYHLKNFLERYFSNYIELYTF